MVNPLRITFVLPGAGLVPVGGFKAVYEYANHLSRRGHKITVVHSARLCINENLSRVARSTLWYLYRRGTGKYGPDSWFLVDPSVKLLWVPSLSKHHIPDGDVVIATAWQTAEWVAEYPHSKGQKLYLIQHLETWSGPEDRVYATWRLPLKKIVVAKWLEQFGKGIGEESVCIPYGLDFETFTRKMPPDQRNPSTVMMLYHEYNWKGSKDGLDALHLVRDRTQNLTVTLFGTSRPSGFPSWISYYCSPPQTLLSDLYNASSIFVAPSWTEGWGLPATEAMMCGAALTATETTGHLEFAIHEKTALLSPIKSPHELARNVLRLIEDNALRIRLAQQGYEYVQQFTWRRAADRFEAVLLGVTQDTKN